VTARPSKLGNQLAGVKVDIVDVADVAIIDLLVVVVLDLHDLVAGAKVQPKRSTLRSPAGFSAFLQFHVERAGADTAAVHRAQHLDVADGIKAEALRDAGLYQFE